MNNFDDILNTPGQSVPQDNGGKQPWQIEAEENKQSAYAMIDKTLTEFSEGGGNLQSYLDVQSKFDRYSARNALLIMEQKPDAIKIGDYGYWKDQGVFVKKQERSNPILILEPGNEYTREDGSVGQYYNAKKLYDITQTTTREKSQPTVNRDERLLLKALINNPPAPIKTVEELPNGVGAFYDHDANEIQVRKGMDASDIFRSVSLELAHAELAAGNEDYTRNDAGMTAFCVSYMLCKKNSIDTKGYDLSRLSNVFEGKEPQEVGAELSQIRDTAHSISSRMAKVLEPANKAPKQQGQER